LIALLVAVGQRQEVVERVGLALVAVLMPALERAAELEGMEVGAVAHLLEIQAAKAGLAVVAEALVAGPVAHLAAQAWLSLSGNYGRKLQILSIFLGN